MYFADLRTHVHAVACTESALLEGGRCHSELLLHILTYNLGRPLYYWTYSTRREGDNKLL